MDRFCPLALVSILRHDEVVIIYSLCLLMCLSLSHLPGMASVSINPFLRPGSNQKPAPSVPIDAGRTKIPQVNISREIEFRGYFLLKGEPFFCLFNKKSNHGEWIALNEATFENFEVSEFDLETETITILFDGQTFSMSLLESKSSPSPKSSLPKSTIAGLPIPSSKGTKASTAPIYMPPKPTETPTLPPWLINRKNALSNERQASDTTNLMFPGTSPVYAGAVPRRIQTSSPATGGGGNRISENPANIIQAPNFNNTRQVQQTAENQFDPLEDEKTSNEINLDDLPPPPPPPNILPPTPPPNIIPVRD